MIYKKIDELKPHPMNEYYFDETEEANFEILKASLSKLSEKERRLDNEILITEDNIIICGHQRVRACKELGWDKVNCKVEKGLSEEEVEIKLIMDNLSQRTAKGLNPLKLGRCINKICEYFGLKNGNNQYTQQNRVANNLRGSIGKFTTKKELSEAFGVTETTLRDYQSLASNSIDELEQAVLTGDIKPTSGIKLSKLSPENQKHAISKIKNIDKLTDQKVKEIIKEVKNPQPIKEKTTIEDTPIRDDNINNMEVEINNIQTNANNITFEDINNYLDYGNGDDSERTNINELKSCVNNPAPHMTYFENLELYHRWILESFQKTKTLFEKNSIHEPTLQELYDELTNYADELEELAENIRWISENYVDTILTVIDDIKDLKDDEDVANCDEQGYLYNGAGKKIGQIENYNSKLTFECIEYNEQDNKDYAYDENGTVIGLIKWFDE